MENSESLAPIRVWKIDLRDPEMFVSSFLSFFFFLINWSFSFPLMTNKQLHAIIDGDAG